MDSRRTQTTEKTNRAILSDSITVYYSGRAPPNEVSRWQVERVFFSTTGRAKDLVENKGTRQKYVFVWICTRLTDTFPTKTPQWRGYVIVPSVVAKLHINSASLHLYRKHSSRFNSASVTHLNRRGNWSGKYVKRISEIFVSLL